MGRLPFDPGRMEGPPPDEPGRQRRFANVAEAQQLTVVQLAELIKTTLEQRIPSPLRVIGEVSNLSTPGHWYFSLKDDQAVVSCVAWASSARKFGFTPKDGDEVVATGHVSHYAPQGRTQFYVSRLQAVGAGALELKFRALCEELRGLGYFDEAHRVPLPFFPRRIAVITSPDGAAVQDVIATARARCPAVGLVIVPVRVQGEGAAEEVARAIRFVDRNHERLGVDAIVVTRGGGSMEDLWAFNERVLADATFGCVLPIVAAIGHESDTTIIELVADARAATPTQAAMRLVPAAEDLRRQLAHLGDRLGAVFRRRLERGRQQIDSFARLEIFRDPRAIVRRASEHLEHARRHLRRAVRMRVTDEHVRLERLAARFAAVSTDALVTRRQIRVAVLSDRLVRAIARRVDDRPRLERLRRSLSAAVARHVRRSAERLRALQREFTAVTPTQVLARGYSYTTHFDGRLVRSAEHVRPGERVVTNVSDGSFESIVSQRRAGPERARPSEREPETPCDGAQMDLFRDEK